VTNSLLSVAKHLLFAVAEEVILIGRRPPKRDIPGNHSVWSAIANLGAHAEPVLAVGPDD